ncbi:cysteine--tRNA ligase, partial [Patescibacteria group bacterium]|nr:cysteine--tRNA ligase [Patescibacteria group bacterium]
MFKLYNTLTHKKQEFKPIKSKKVGLYTCGPTVYDFAHIGNLRTYIFEDILKRTLKMNGYAIKHVMNITDVGHLVSDADTGEDKMMKALRREGLKPDAQSMKELANKYFLAFKKDTGDLNIIPPDERPKATEHIKEQVELIKMLMVKGCAYETADAVYFDTARLKDYGKLAHGRAEVEEALARVESSKEKRNAPDFALWIKAVGRHEKHVMQWPSPWGRGFPGWHTECSAMSRKYLGQPFDIHCGGVDHIPVHHTNEIAQSEAAYGAPMANYWLHAEFLTFGRNKMAKSAGTFISLADMEKKGFKPLAYRYLCLTAHYRSKLNFTWESLAAAQNALESLYEVARYWPKPEAVEPSRLENFKEALNDDLDTPRALAELWFVVKSIDES